LSRGEAYSTEELDAISAVAADVDPRFAGVWEIARDTGRRLGAIRTLRVEHLAIVEDREDTLIIINFPAKTDKARKRGRVFLTKYGREAVERLLDRAEVQASGWLFPKGRLEYDDDHEGPIGDGALLAMLKKAEKLAGIGHISGRGFHGVKRRVVTELMDSFAGDAGAVGTITGNIEPSVLQSIYRQHEDGVRMAAARELERRRGSQSTNNPQKQSETG
jgi:integrase